MDPLTALSVAAATAQFISFAHEAITTYREIRESGNATKYNRELEDAVKVIKMQRNELLKDATNASINVVARDCTADADDLLQLLEQIRGNKQNKLVTVFRAMTKKGKVERLEKSLMAKEDRLGAVLLQDLHISLDNLPSKITELQKGINDLQAQQNQQASMVQDIRLAQQQSSKAIDELNVVQQHKQLLDSLSFPEISLRQDNIKDPHEGTLDWIYPASDSTKTPDLAAWLEGPGGSIFWISGKPASGKSTLMARIANDERTAASLQKWSGERKLLTLAHFFWKPGTKMQKSVNGMLRTLLYQICLSRPDLVSTAPFYRMLDHTRAWSTKALVPAIEAALGTPGMVFCLFVDGLDECEDDYDELVDLLQRLHTTSEHIKICVSSRPEVELSARFKECNQFRMQDYNSTDIKRYVYDTLGSRDRIALDIVHAAQGVFLWAMLVSKSVKKGRASGDDESTIYQRLLTTPADIHDLILEMIKRLDPVQKRSLYFYLQAMNLYQHTQDFLSVCVLAAARDEDINDYAQLLTACLKVELQITAQSAGLLEVPKFRSPAESEHDCGSRCTAKWYAIPSKLATSDARYSRDTCFAEFPAPCPFQDILAFNTVEPSWVHRCASDVVKESLQEDIDLLWPAILVKEKCLRGARDTLLGLPIIDDEDCDSYKVSITSIESYIDAAYDHEQASPLTSTEQVQLKQLCNIFDSRWDAIEFYYWSPFSFPACNGRLSGLVSIFWYMCQHCISAERLIPQMTRFFIKHVSDLSSLLSLSMETVYHLPDDLRKCECIQSAAISLLDAALTKIVSSADTIVSSHHVVWDVEWYSYPNTAASYIHGLTLEPYSRVQLLRIIAQAVISLARWDRAFQAGFPFDGYFSCSHPGTICFPQEKANEPLVAQHTGDGAVGVKSSQRSTLDLIASRCLTISRKLQLKLDIGGHSWPRSRLQIHAATSLWKVWQICGLTPSSHLSRHRQVPVKSSLNINAICDLGEQLRLIFRTHKYCEHHRDREVVHMVELSKLATIKLVVLLLSVGRAAQLDMPQSVVHLSKLYETAEKVLLDSVRDSALGLTSTQQMFARTCIRHSLKHYWFGLFDKYCEPELFEAVRIADQRRWILKWAQGSYMPVTAGQIL